MHDVVGVVLRLPCGYPTVQGSWHFQGVVLEPNELTFIWMQWEMELDGYICHILPGFFPGWDRTVLDESLHALQVLLYL